MQRLKDCNTIPELMREEGQARMAYYSAFNEILELDEPFEKRVRRPPDNMLNSLISFINTLIYTAVLSEIYVTQLNPTISYLHEPSERRFSLALDVSEIFKPLIGDKIIFRLLNRRIIDREDFEGIGDEPAIYLKEDARKRVLKEFEETLQTTVYHRKLKRNVSYRHLIRLEAYKIIRHLIGMEAYRSLRAWW
jgi:CRISPR-associated protein Cas1